jgi:ABC-type uncharacterized transport system substrate-binding protein
MRRWSAVWVLVAAVGWLGGIEAASAKVRIVVVDGYHREYLWSQETSKGLCAALLKFGYLDSQDQADAFTRDDQVESSRAMVKKLWMDTKRKSSKTEMETSTLELTQAIKAFEPTILLLGDDNAANYIGNQFLDTEVPVVFWGVNNTPVKYGLVDSAERPGHNVTGVVQTGFYVESLQLLKTMVPTAKTFAILSDESETARSHNKAIEALARDGALPMTLVETIATSEFAVFKQKALELQDRVDAFFLTLYATLKDEQGQHVPDEEATRWYLTNIRIPETGRSERQIKQGLLCGVDEPGYDHGFEVGVIAHDVLNGADPATYPPRVSKSGPRMANRQRAAMLGIPLTAEMGIERSYDEALALPQTAEAKP